MLGDKTLLQYVMEEELKTFTATHKAIYEAPKEPLEINGNGSFLIEINSSSTSFQKIMSEEYRNVIAELPTKSTEEYRRQLGEKIIKLDENRTIPEALKLVYSTYNLVKERFAGTIFILDTGALINPLHPLVALELLRKQQEITVSKILIYSYKNLVAIQSKYGSSKNVDSFDLSIKTLMKMYQSQIKERSVHLIENEYDATRRQLKQKYKVSKFPGEDQSKEYYLVAHQLLTKGTYVPIYGTSLIQMNGNTSGYHLTPFKSCNISSHNSTEPVSVCTGSTSNKTLEGLRTLHHANLGSPYQADCLTSLSKPYADACIKQSFEIFQAAKII